MVRVEKRELQSSGELSPDGGFACAGQANERDHAENARVVRTITILINLLSQ
jgi:hypothetical protein